MESNTPTTPASAAPHRAPAPPPPPAPRRHSFWGKIGTTLLTVIVLGSIVANIYLFGIVKMLSGGGEAVYEKGTPEHRIAIVTIEGAIDEQMYQHVHHSLKQLDEKPPKAIVLRVDSPGGGVAASDRIYNEIKTFKEKHSIPVIASFGGVAASGGYYVAMAADKIVAEPTCITGSIGVIGQIFTFETLLTEKLGIQPEVLTATTSPEKEIGNNVFRNWDERDETLWLKIMDAAHARFVDIVVEGRKHASAEAQIRDAAKGQVFTAAEAVANKLIDEEGYIDTAIARAAAAANIPAGVDPEVTILRREKGLLASMIGVSSQSPSASSIDATTIRTWLTELSTPRLEYRFTGPQ